MNTEVIRTLIRQYGDRVGAIGSEAVAQPATPAELQHVQLESTQKLGVELDAACLYLESLADGIGAPGLPIYTTIRKHIEDPGSEYKRDRSARREEH